MQSIVLNANQVSTATDIQRAVDTLRDTGGAVTLAAMELELDRGIELHSGVMLQGQGRNTVLRSAPGSVYPLNGHHIYGLYDVSLKHTDGLKPGMTVAIRDDQYRNFFETFTRIKWIEGNRVGLDQPLASDYGESDSNPRLINSFPLVFGRSVQKVAVRGLTLDGNRSSQPEGIGACRGAALYFIYSRECTVEDVQETSFPGEGLGFQMCAHLHIKDCRFSDNTGNAYHPGAGSIAGVFQNCVAEDNGRCGFFFCARANHITVEQCLFKRNKEAGISIGILDCHNRIVGCDISDNMGPGILFRPERRPTEVHSCVITRCRIERNTGEILGQIDIRGDAHDLVITNNQITGISNQETAGVSVAPECKEVYLSENRISQSSPEVSAVPASLTDTPPKIRVGADDVQPEDFRHLRVKPE